MRRIAAVIATLVACSDATSSPPPPANPSPDAGEAGAPETDASDAGAAYDANELITDDGTTIEVDVDAGAPLPDAGGPCATGSPIEIRPVAPMTKSQSGELRTVPAGKGFANMVDDDGDGDGNATVIECLDDTPSSPTWFRFPFETVAVQGTITRVVVFARVRATSADDAKAGVGLFVTSSSSVASSPRQDLGQSYGVVSRVFETFPTTGVGWQAADLQKVEIRVTCVPSKPDKPVRITQIWAVVCAL